ncbi:nitroreductase family deazaflavin-dependent oxidoreductase [Streptomyces sp. ISL-112]|uniref:nitroreductase family deazaflavin-dependent oxidoreductase n=1 Tax=unclassified Streptomyces TaxID=2593676 RepID=UPI001BE7E60D|nr:MULTISPECIES: nitroreductase family deazaflavin-dependent oxidoreductase [unclassified Streptomyces]MBT2429294.1 nitroreductase family deazaflavin-dependent oxidoreductase [Streptomyces sp. ISL-112]MBT2460468.1 nitroreductase family deazaflavin-dependent oxidoreductase [Streptomyces sp. ISL-63]
MAFYRAGLGPALGRRLLLLRHTGQHSGLDRYAVLAVVAHDPDQGTWILASGFGPTAAWCRNLQAAPKTSIQVGNRHYAVTAHFPSADEGSELMARYTRYHPRAARRLCAFMGVRVPDGSPHSYRQVGLLVSPPASSVQGKCCPRAASRRTKGMRARTLGLTMCLRHSHASCE